MLIIFIFLLAIIIPIAFGIVVWMMANSLEEKGKNERIRDCNERVLNRKAASVLLWVIAAIMCFIACGVSAGWYNANVHKRAQLENFYTSNSMNYADATNMSNNILLQAKFVEGFGGIGVGLAYEGQSEAVTNALIQWRDAVNQYNKDLAGYRAGQQSWLTNWFYLSTDLEPLAIK